ncbi:hypothetical protein BT69DRAFT_558688 [Atractiella rhizophila]|nr:hypothetical protein BT69DRAFT_558688 [Atractiella rhizophila]
MRDLDRWYEDRYRRRPSRPQAESEGGLPKLLPTLLVHFPLGLLPATLLNDLIHVLVLYATRLPIFFFFHSPNPSALDEMSAQTRARLEVGVFEPPDPFEEIIRAITTANPNPAQTLLLTKDLVEMLREAYENMNRSIDAFLSGLHYAHLAHANVFPSPPPPSLLRSLPSFQRYIASILRPSSSSSHPQHQQLKDLNPSLLMTDDNYLLSTLHSHFHPAHIAFFRSRAENERVCAVAESVYGTKGWERIGTTDSTRLLTFLETAGAGWEGELATMRSLLEGGAGEGRRNLINGLLLGGVVGNQMGEKDQAFTRLVQMTTRRMQGLREGMGERGYEGLVFWELWYIDCHQAVRQVNS